MNSIFLEPVAKEWLQGLLRTGPALVTFVKADGTERKMNCSLQEDIIEPYEKKETAKDRKSNEEVLAVYDLDKKAWRSFRLDSIISIEFN